MAITFTCGHCGRVLTTSDDKAGLKAKCPGCGEVVVVPEADLVDSSQAIVEEIDERSEESVAAPTHPPGPKTCPMCGAENPPRARTCSACGEKFPEADEGAGRRRRGIRTNVEVGEVLSDAWETFKANFGVALGGNIVSSIVMGMGFMPFVVLLAVALALSNPPEFDRTPPVPLLVGMIPAFLLGVAASCWIMPGVLKLFIGLARQDADVELTTIFKGGRYFLPYLGVSMVFGLCLTAATAMCGVPGLILFVFGWPITYVLCDDETPQGNYWGRTLALTRPNWTMSLLLVLAIMGMMLGIGLVGAIPCIGPIFSLMSILIQPYFQLLWATAYVKMSGQD